MTVTQYDQIGDDYNNIVVLPTSILQHTAIRTHIGDVHDLDVLDIACGTGVHSHHFAKAGARKVLGLDLSDAMVESARRQAVDNGVSEFRVADGSKPLRVGQFDLVLAAWLLNYACNVDELQIMWQNLFDSLKPGGRCVGIVPDMNQAQSPDGENPFGQSSKLLDTVPGGVRVRTTLYANTPMSFNHYVRELAVLEECARQAGFLGVQWMPPVDPHISGVDFASFVKAPVFQVFSVTRPSCEI